MAASRPELSLANLLAFIAHPKACNVVEKYLAFYCNQNTAKESETSMYGSLEHYIMTNSSVVNTPGEYRRESLLVDAVHDIMLHGARRGLNVKEVQHFVAIVMELLMAISEENSGKCIILVY